MRSFVLNFLKFNLRYKKNSDIAKKKQRLKLQMLTVSLNLLTKMKIVRYNKLQKTLIAKSLR